MNHALRQMQYRIAVIYATLSVYLLYNSTEQLYHMVYIYIPLPLYPSYSTEQRCHMVYIYAFDCPSILLTLQHRDASWVICIYIGLSLYLSYSRENICHMVYIYILDCPSILLTLERRGASKQCIKLTAVQICGNI